MRFYGRAEGVAQRIIQAFQAGEIPKALANVFIHHNGSIPCHSWSWSNQMIVALYGHTDARGYRQWEQVNRHVRKGERAFNILVPIIKVIEETDKDTGEPVERRGLVGFKSAPVFGFDQTDGDPLPGDQESRRFVESLPLVEVAKAWGLNVGTYNGQGSRYLGYYRHGQGIALGVENLSTWAHELVHAAEYRLNRLSDRGKKDWAVEVVAELGGAVLLTMLGREHDADVGGAWAYIDRRSKAGGKDNPVSACIQVINRVCAAVSLILETGEKIDDPERPGPDRPSPAPAPSPSPEKVKETYAEPDRYTRAPREWIGRVLYDWGKKGLRNRGCIRLPADTETKRKRMTFNLDWFYSDQLRYVKVPNPQLVRSVRKVTKEIWPVKERRGRYWRTKHYLVPREALERARAILAERSGVAAASV